MDEQDILQEGKNLLKIFSKLYEEDRDEYSELYLVMKIMMDQVTDKDKQHMKEEIEKSKGQNQKLTIAVYGPFLDQYKNDATKTLPDDILKILINKTQGGRSPQNMLYLTHGAQYCLWYGMTPNISNEAEQFGLPATSTHKDVYEALLCSIDIPFPVNITLDSITKLQDMDLYVELLLSCVGLRRSVNMADVENVYKNFFYHNDTDKQKWHCKMVLWFLLKRMAEEARTPSPPLSPPPSSKQLQKSN